MMCPLRAADLPPKHHPLMDMVCIHRLPAYHCQTPCPSLLSSQPIFRGLFFCSKAGSPPRYGPPSAALKGVPSHAIPVKMEAAK